MGTSICVTPTTPRRYQVYVDVTQDDDLNNNGVPDCLDGDIDLCPTDDAKTLGQVYVDVTHQMTT